MERKCYENEDEIPMINVQPARENWAYDSFAKGMRFTPGIAGIVHLADDDLSGASNENTFVNPVASEKIRPAYSNRDPLDTHPAIEIPGSSGGKHRQNKTSEMRRLWIQGGATMPSEYEAHLRVHNRLPFKRIFNKDYCYELVSDRIIKIKNDEKAEARKAKKARNKKPWVSSENSDSEQPVSSQSNQSNPDTE